MKVYPDGAVSFLTNVSGVSDSVGVGEEPQQVCLSLSFVVRVGLSHLQGPALETIMWARKEQSALWRKPCVEKSSHQPNAL